MESMMNQMSPLQMFGVIASQLWLYVIFPVMVFRKINYLTQLVESQFEEETDETSS